MVIPGANRRGTGKSDRPPLIPAGDDAYWSSQLLIRTSRLRIESSLISGPGDKRRLARSQESINESRRRITETDRLIRQMWVQAPD